jgi:hypothetical protein
MHWLQIFERQGCADVVLWMPKSFPFVFKWLFLDIGRGHRFCSQILEKITMFECQQLQWPHRQVQRIENGNRQA